MSGVSRRHVLVGAAGAASTLLLAPSPAALAVGPGCATRRRVPGLLAADMIGRHEGRLHGVPDWYDWAAGPRLGMGNDPGDWEALIPWGQIYEDADGSPARNVRVACRDMAAWVRSRRTGRWTSVVSSVGVDGANYAEDYVDNESKPADLRQEPDGSVSATLGDGYNFHFWTTTGRVEIDPDDIGGVVTLYSARVIVDDPAGPDERDRARYLAGGGGDYWLDVTAGWQDFQTNGDIGIGKARYLDSDWQTLTMSTLPLAVLRRTCPPVCLRGR